MSVYTPVSESELLHFLSHYEIQGLRTFAGIENGVENSNYLVNTDQGKFVVTIFEELGPTQIPDYLSLLTDLTTKNIPCVPPIRDRQGNMINTLATKPASLFPFIQGSSPQDVTTAQLQALGHTLGRLHHATSDKYQHFDSRPHDDAITETTSLLTTLNNDQQQLFNRALRLTQNLDRMELPQGVIHGDLFRDNTLFIGDQLQGVLDFYGASTDACLLDLAICVTDWCRTVEGKLEQNKIEVLVRAYQDIRSLDEKEKTQWSNMLAFAAFRFWCSRLKYRQRHQQQVCGQQKDPEEYRQLLKFIFENVEELKI